MLKKCFCPPLNQAQVKVWSTRNNPEQKILTTVLGTIRNVNRACIVCKLQYGRPYCAPTTMYQFICTNVMREYRGCNLCIVAYSQYVLRLPTFQYLKVLILWRSNLKFLLDSLVNILIVIQKQVLTCGVISVI